MSNFTPCTSLPSNLHPWWIRTQDGGNSPCILGSPAAEPGATIANCVGWAWGRYQQIRGSVDSRLPSINAGGWYAAAVAAGMPHGSEPQLGAVLCLSGHVCIVEEIAADGSFINCSESDWGGPVFSYRTRYRSRNWILQVGGFQGFIYQEEEPEPEPGPGPEPEPPGPDPEHGNNFRWWMARKLILSRRNIKL